MQYQTCSMPQVAMLANQWANNADATLRTITDCRAWLNMAQSLVALTYDRHEITRDQCDSATDELTRLCHLRRPL